MIRGTTPTYMIHFDFIKGATVADIEEVCLTFKQNSSGVLLAKHIPADGGEILSDGAYITLTQAETRAFRKGRVNRQALVKFYGGTVITEKKITKEQVYDVLHEVDH